MRDISEYDEYEIDEAEIEKAMRILKAHNPDNATPEDAIDFLVYLRSIVHELAHESDIEDLDKLYERYAKEKEVK